MQVQNNVGRLSDLRLEDVHKILGACKTPVNRENLMNGKIPPRVMQQYIALLNRRGFIDILYRIQKGDQICQYIITSAGEEIVELMNMLYNLIGGFD